MYIYGKNVVKETINNKKEIKKAYIWDKFNDKEITNELQKQKIPIKYITKHEIEEMTQGNHQGIIIEIPDFNYTDIEYTNNKEFIIILDHIEDEHNFGAIIRTCEAAGIDAIIIPKDRSVSVTSTVMKTSAGAVNNINICRVTNLRDTINYLKKHGYWIVGTDMNQSTEYTKTNLDMKIALIIGNEGNGLSNIIKKECDYIVNIPMYGKINSLNASVAAGIIIYEVLKQKRK